ncbi:hypothetical protein EXU85_20395 [Spirosoma sp. KCTC 42546]|uniref:hypothetical protein n=1 Tax=Spirosoma sp. KCTC 42546 TaxID=2520506 RepID=UPI00115BE24E|nr:hypothetical protein [Spirosoma sp. KCTC 42546]QDK80840.1 hypothetical protein EXU85_20395 [Spirosoma sp. KCTC 42546]
MNDLSTQFFTQLFQRLEKKTPKFFNILTVVLGVLATLAASEEAYEKTLEVVPPWLTYVGYGLKVAFFLSGIITAQAAIKGPTPPLGDDQLPKKS